MIPHVEDRALSFIAIGNHYLYDETPGRTSTRVAWTHTRNTPTSDPVLALRWMQWTAWTAPQIKKLSGIPLSGRVPGPPCYYYSLSWNPQERPTRAEVMQAALETLDVLGLLDHETVIVAHQEKPHFHIHCICSLVHWRTGRRQPVNFEFVALSRWAESWERRGGKIYCPNRVINNKKRQESAKKQQRAIEAWKAKEREDPGPRFHDRERDRGHDWER